MANIQEQLAHLRKTVASIDRKYEVRPVRQASVFVEEILTGQVVDTPPRPAF